MVEEGNVWWCRMGENVGVEINGKGKDFTRPVIIHTKFTATSFLVIPMTTKLEYKSGDKKEGSWFTSFRHQGVDNLACLSQIRVVDYRRLKNKMGYLDDKDFGRICVAFEKVYCKNKSPQ